MAGLGSMGAVLSMLGGCQFVSPPASSTPSALRRIGYLSGAARASSQPFWSAFVDQLRQLGWTEGVNISIDWRFAEGHFELLPELAAKLVRTPVDVILGYGGPGAINAHLMTNVIPIVMGSGPDPDTLSAAGLYQSVARPGGNITGTTAGVGTTSTKAMELLRIIQPQMSRLAIFGDLSTSTDADYRPAATQAASTLGIQVQDVDVRNANDIDHAFEAIRTFKAEGVFVIVGGTLVSALRSRIAELVAVSRLPAMYTFLPAAIDDGGLMALSSNYVSAMRQAAEYVDKILRGASPADLPIVEPRDFEFVVNVRAAQALGITFPPDAAAQVTQWVQ
jgi:putative ABC transport system substrate-binding protein